MGYASVHFVKITHDHNELVVCLSDWQTTRNVDSHARAPGHIQRDYWPEEP